MTSQPGKWFARLETELRLGVPGEVTLDALREQTFTSPLAPAGQRGAAAFCLHPGTKAVLPFAGAF